MVDYGAELKETSSMKKYFLAGIGVLFLASAALAADADIEGRINTVDYTKNTIVVRNELKNKIGNRDYRIHVKQGMINNYKSYDRLKVWLSEDGKDAAMIELINH